MTLPANTTIYFSQVNSELGKPATQALYMSQMRGLAGVGSGPIYMSQLWGKSSYTPMSTSQGAVYDERSYTATNSTTGTWYPSVNVSGGSGGYTFSWGIASNPGGFTQTNNGSQVCSITHPVPRFGFSGACTMVCTITDNTGHQVVVYVDVYVNLYGNQ